MIFGIVDWEYYNALHDTVSQKDFDKAEALAEKEVLLVVGRIRWSSLDSTAFYYEQLKDCICNVIDKMEKDRRSDAGKGVSSVSNDGYSEHYTIQTESQARAELQNLIREWLSGTGLAGAY